MNLGQKGFISGSSLFDEVIRYNGILVCPKKNQKIVKTCCLLKEAPENSEDLLSSQRGLGPFPFRLTPLDNRLLPLWEKYLRTSDFNIFAFCNFNYRLLPLYNKCTWSIRFQHVCICILNYSLLPLYNKCTWSMPLFIRFQYVCICIVASCC